MIVIGGGPAGLMAAEVLAAAGVAVDVYDAMASVGRKFLLAGKGGMNLTHGEAWPAFIGRYGARATALHDIIKDFDPSALRAWALALGVETFVGSSGRVFPVDMKAAPLLRAWLHALRGDQVRFHMRHRWTGAGAADGTAGAAGQGWEFASTNGLVHAQADAVVLALGGGSWARLGSDGAWVPWLQQRGVEVSPLVAANCGFDTHWSPFFKQNFAGQPVLTVAARTATGSAPMRQGQFVITEGGVEGSLIYALSSALRQQLEQDGDAVLELDLLPDKSAERLAAELVSGRGARSLSTHLRSKLGLDRLKIALLHEVLTPEQMRIPAMLAQTIKALPLRLHATRPLDEAISSAGGVCFEALDETLMLRACPGVFCAGEMLDWEAPTGGYLLTASMASGRQAARGVLKWLQINKTARSLSTE